jgi:hypothetical protein
MLHSPIVRCHSSEGPKLAGGPYTQTKACIFGICIVFKDGHRTESLTVTFVQVNTVLLLHLSLLLQLH